MSKLFSAMQRGRGGIPGMISSMVDHDPSKDLVEPAAPEPAPTMAQAVMAAAGIDDTPPAPVEPRGTAAMRREPLRVPGLAPVLPFDAQHLVASEQYRIIRTKIIQHPRQPRVILVSSAWPGDGKSITAVNLAGALALKVNAKVLLVDGDFRHCALHELLGMPRSPGLSEVLAGKCDFEEAVVQAQEYPNLYFLANGEDRANPSELLDSPRWHRLCEEFLLAFRYIIIDSSPIGTVADYDLLKASSDGVIVVVRPDHTKRNVCLNALATIPRDKLIGIIVNGVSRGFLTRYPTAGYYSKRTSDPANAGAQGLARK